MPKKGKAKIVGVIEISSSELRLKIAQSNKGKYKLLDSLVYPLGLGHDTFTIGKISFEKVDKACDLIRNFLNVTKEYGVEEVRAVATTALREATNRDYILDQIKIKTGLTLNVLADYEEKLYIKRIMFSTIDKAYLKSALMVYMGSGNIGISLLQDGKIPHIENIKAGSLRIHEIFGKVQNNSIEFHTVVEEYLDSLTRTLQTKIPQNVKYLIASGHEISMIASLCEAEISENLSFISKEKFRALYDDVKFKSEEKIVLDYKLPLEKARVLFSSMCIYNSLLRFIKSDTIIAPVMQLNDAIIFHMLYPETAERYSVAFDKNTITQGKILAKNFDAIESHFEKVSKFSIKIFDKLKKLHGLGDRERLLLQMSAIFHDIGKFINMKDHHKHSYNIICGLDIAGITLLETEIIANIVFYHSKLTPSTQHENFNKLSTKDRVTVSKLCSILRIADSLDRMTSEKFQDIDIKLIENELVITVTTDQNMDLELFSFNEKRLFFEEVFGIKGVLKKKKVI